MPLVLDVERDHEAALKYDARREGLRLRADRRGKGKTPRVSQARAWARIVARDGISAHTVRLWIAPTRRKAFDRAYRCAAA